MLEKKLHKSNLEKCHGTKTLTTDFDRVGKAAFCFNGYKTSKKLQLRALRILPEHKHFRDLNSFILHFAPSCPSHHTYMSFKHLPGWELYV